MEKINDLKSDSNDAMGINSALVPTTYRIIFCFNIPFMSNALCYEEHLEEHGKSYEKRSRIGYVISQ